MEQEKFLGKTISKKDADKDSYVTNYITEKMYSEEEVIELLKTFDEKFNSGIVERNKGINNWFEQFKKK